ncbi:hypothetical protein [Hoeflea sp.]|uniref:hypothetical protein n=1 Tax=Hoeflea sp. TaxID=1940281 RepID=UPI003B02996B
MKNHRYTFDLGNEYGPKLEALAARSHCKDTRAFAETIIRRAIDIAEAIDQAEDAVYALRSAMEETPNLDLDDGIPF